jgi:ABC-type multidrug transport system permease subunit
MGAMGGGGDDGEASAPRVELGVEDRDQSDVSRELIGALQAADGLRVSVVDDVRREVRGGEFACGLVIPAGYGAGLGAGEPPELALLRDPSQALSQQVVLFQLAPVLLQRQAQSRGAGLMDRVIELFEFPDVMRAPASAAMRESYERIETLMAELPEVADEGAEGEGPPDLGGFDPLQELPGLLGLRSEDVAGQGEGSAPRQAGASHAFAAMAVMMLLFGVVGAGGTLLQERAEGTLTRLQLTPAAGGAVLLGKLLSMALVSLAQLLVLFTYGAIVFDVPVLEAPQNLVLVSVLWVYLALGIGLLFAVLCRSQKQLEGLSTLVILVMSAVGGAWFPREITPDWFRAIGSVTPVAWAMDAYHGVLWYGKGLLGTSEVGGLWPQLLVMAVVGSGLLGLTAYLYPRRYR